MNARTHTGTQFFLRTQNDGRRVWKKPIGCVWVWVDAHAPSIAWQAAKNKNKVTRTRDTHTTCTQWNGIVPSLLVRNFSAARMAHNLRRTRCARLRKDENKINDYAIGVLLLFIPEYRIPDKPSICRNFFSFEKVEFPFVGTLFRSEINSTPSIKLIRISKMESVIGWQLLVPTSDILTIA